MTSTSEDASNWRSFMVEPAAYMAGSRLTACFGAINAGLASKLLETGRLRDRLSAFIIARYELPPWIAPEDCGELDRTIALSSPADLETVAQRAGAIYWSSAIASAVLTKEVKALQEAAGAENCAFAIKHRDLAGPDQEFHPLETIAARMLDDGLRCFAGWCDALPPGVGKRVRLKLQASPLLDAPATSPFDKRGPAIIRRAASQ